MTAALFQFGNKNAVLKNSSSIQNGSDLLIQKYALGTKWAQFGHEMGTESFFGRKFTEYCSNLGTVLWLDDIAVS